VSAAIWWRIAPTPAGATNEPPGTETPPVAEKLYARSSIPPTPQRSAFASLKTKICPVTGAPCTTVPKS
jgi:hypothetical protein